MCRRALAAPARSNTHSKTKGIAMLHSESVKTIAPALLAAQREISVALKDGKNPHFNHNYATLEAVIEAVKDPLNANGISFLQAIGSGDGGPHVETMLLHESGEFVATITPVYCTKPDNPQAFGSGVTYSKRYALQALCGLPSEDDDANGATGDDDKKPGKPTPKAQPKEAVDLAKLKSDAGMAWLRRFKGPADALRSLRQTKEVTIEVEAFINEMFDAGVVG